MIVFAMENAWIIDICRKTFPALKATVYRDFLEIMKKLGLYSEANHNKTDNIYKLGQSEIHFYSADHEQKLRGRKRDILWLNEANEFKYDDWRQYVFRTPGRIFLDYNPSDEFHWIYDYVLTRDDCTFIRSTYKDNTTLDLQTIREIERLKEEDPDYWRVFGEGERGTSREIIWSKWDIQWEEKPAISPIFGLDFGYSNPMALVEARIYEREAFIEQKIYEAQMTTDDLIDRLRQIVPKGAEIYADSAEPDRIEQIYRAGFNIKPAEKAVKAGIDAVNTFQLHINPSSAEMIKEIQNYKFKVDKNGNRLEEPVKFNDHAMDALRYALFTDKQHVRFKPEFIRAR